MLLLCDRRTTHSLILHRKHTHTQREREKRGGRTTTRNMVLRATRRLLGGAVCKSPFPPPSSLLPFLIIFLWGCFALHLIPRNSLFSPINRSNKTICVYTFHRYKRLRHRVQIFTQYVKAIFYLSIQQNKYTRLSKTILTKKYNLNYLSFQYFPFFPQLHPDAFKGGRKPGQVWPRNIGQITNYEWLFIFAGSMAMMWPAMIIYHRYIYLEESAWVEEHYDPMTAYERDWANKHCPRDYGHRTVTAFPRPILNGNSQ